MPRFIARSSPVLLVLAALLLLACGGGNRGLPSAAGEYPIQNQSIGFDGREYSFYWAGPDGTLHHAQGHDFKLVQGERTFLEVGQGTPVVHLKPDEPVAVRGRDRDGAFSSWWFPFLLGYALSGGGGPIIQNPAPVPQSGPPATTPTYRYPPTDTFGRGDTLHGSEATSRASPPDYRKVQPAPYAVSGQGGGTGGGAAATNRDANPVAGQSGGAGDGTAASDRGRGVGASGQAGGTGAGAAAGDKGRAGSDSGVSAAPAAPAPGSGVTSRPGPGASGSRPGVGAGSSSGGGRSGGGRR